MAYFDSKQKGKKKEERGRLEGSAGEERDREMVLTIEKMSVKQKGSDGEEPAETLGEKLEKEQVRQSKAEHCGVCRINRTVCVNALQGPTAALSHHLLPLLWYNHPQLLYTHTAS